MEETKENGGYVLYTSEGKYVGTLDNFIMEPKECKLADRFEGLSYEARYSRYAECSKDSLITRCIVKDRTNDLMLKRSEGARAVIDLIAAAVGMGEKNYCLYYPDIDYNSPIVKAIDKAFWTSKAGEKAQLKKRIQELERENEVLMSLLGKDGQNE